jgi:hypothetical protein
MAPNTNYGTSASPRRNLMNIKTRTLFNDDQGTQNILCFVDRASLYNLVNKANLVHSLS